MDVITDFLADVNWLKVSIAVALVAGGAIIGYIFEKVAINRIKSFASKTAWKHDDEIVASLHVIPELLFGAAGIYLATFFMDISDEALDSLRTGLTVIAILLITIQLARFTRVFVKILAERNTGLSSSSTIFSNIARVVVYVVGILVLLNSLGIDITAVITALGVGGLAVALALQDTLSNLFSGVYLIAARKIKPGDYVELDSGEEGYVEDISWRNTQVRSLGDNKMIIVPNASMASAIVQNYDLPRKDLSVIIACGVSYDSNLEKVETIAIEVGREVQNDVEGGVKDFEPLVRFDEFGDSAIVFNTILRGETYVDQYLVKSEFIKRLHKRFNKEGIEIPFPQIVVHNEK